MKKVNVLFIMDIEKHFYSHGLSEYQIDVYKKAHQCDLVIQVPISQPLDNIEYPRFEVKEFDEKESNFFIEELLALNQERTNIIGKLEHELREYRFKPNKPNYKGMFYTFLILFLFVSIMLYTKL